MPSIDSLITTVDAALANERDEWRMKVEAREHSIRKLEDSLANEQPDCEGCGHPLPSSRSVDALRRLMALERGVPQSQVVLGGNASLWLGGYCDTACRREHQRRSAERQAGLRVLVGGQP